MRFADWIKLVCDVIRALYPIYKDVRETRKNKKAGRSCNSTGNSRKA